MNALKMVKTEDEAREQLLRLRKTVTVRKKPNGNAYVVDGKEYSELELIRLANSVVRERTSRG